jgi:hypothetical protein
MAFHSGSWAGTPRRLAAAGQDRVQASHTKAKGPLTAETARWLPAFPARIPHSIAAGTRAVDSQLRTMTHLGCHSWGRLQPVAQVNLQNS